MEGEMTVTAVDDVWRSNSRILDIELILQGREIRGRIFGQDERLRYEFGSELDTELYQSHDSKFKIKIRSYAKSALCRTNTTLSLWIGGNGRELDKHSFCEYFTTKKEARVAFTGLAAGIKDFCEIEERKETKMKDYDTLRKEIKKLVCTEEQERAIEQIIKKVTEGKIDLTHGGPRFLTNGRYGWDEVKEAVDAYLSQIASNPCADISIFTQKQSGWPKVHIIFNDMIGDLFFNLNEKQYSSLTEEIN